MRQRSADQDEGTVLGITETVWVYYRETWALSPLSRGCLYLMETPYLKYFMMVFECGT